MFLRCCGFCMIFRTEKSISWIVQRVGTQPAGIPPRREKPALMRKGPGFLSVLERHPMERKLLWTRLLQVTKYLWKVQQSKMKCNIAVAISGSMHPTHSFLTVHKVTPVTLLSPTASFVEQKTDRRLTFKAKEEISHLPGSLIFLRITTSRQYQPQHYCAQEEKQSLG